MATISSNVGLVSGLQTGAIVDALIGAQRLAVSRLETRSKALLATQAGLNSLSANLLTLSTSSSQFGLASTFQQYKGTVADPTQLSAVARSGVLPGVYQFQSLRLSSAQQSVSRGFANATTQTVGAGTLVIAPGGKLETETRLSELNGGTGVRRGVIRITDRSGAFADVDLTAAATVTDVVDAINQASGIAVQASVRSDRLVLTDTSGATTTNLSVTDRNNGFAAVDLGLNQSVAAATLSGDSIYEITGEFTLALLNDGNQIQRTSDAADLRITLTDVAGTQLDVDLDTAVTLNDVVELINEHADNGGKLSAALENGRLVLTDLTGGGGASALSATDINGATVANALGLNTAAVDDTLTGQRLGAGMNTVLLRNLRGGQGIDQLGTISLTDRNGTTATIDLSTAETLDDVLAAINSAEDAGTPLTLHATLNDAGNGIQIRDTSGATASNLVIADVGGSTVAEQLGIEIDGNQDSVNSGNLNLRYINEATSLSTYAPGGLKVRTGAFSITNSQGVQTVITLTNTQQDLGDVMRLIETATGGQVTAELNETGDGFVLVDQAGGTGQLKVSELGSTTAAGLRILGTGTTGSDGKSQISSRIATVIEVTADDTLNSISAKLNDAKAGFTSAVIDDGSAFSPKRLSLTAKKTGQAGQFVVDDGGLELGFSNRSTARDALLRIGADPATGFIVQSSTNQFLKVVPGLDVTIKSVGAAATQVTIEQDTSKVVDLVQSFVTSYNDFVNKSKDLTKFDPATGTRGVLQGETNVLRAQMSLSELIVNTRLGPTGNTFRNLSSIGISIGKDGKLSLNADELRTALTEDATSVEKLFTDTASGFGPKLKAVIESLTNSETGKFTLQTNSLQDSVDSLTQRITDMDALLAVRKERLLNQFYKLESLLSTLNGQQQALGKLQSLSSTSKK